MKTRESGMPAEEMWAGFFDPEATLRKLGLTPEAASVVDFGCGYGTFTIPAARITPGLVHAFDIDPAMIKATSAKALAADLRNVRAHLRDFVADGTGLSDAGVDYAMLFNILHAEHPVALLKEARRILKQDALLAITHWNHDPATPRGPSMNIRPTPETCRQWAIEAGFQLAGPDHIDLPPYHYGMIFSPQPRSR